MTTYRAPGVYVVETPSAVQPIAGVGTSTAGFIGVFAAPAARPVAPETITEADGQKKTFRLGHYPANTEEGQFTVAGADANNRARLLTDSRKGASFVTFDLAPKAGPITVTYAVQVRRERDRRATPITAIPTMFSLDAYPVDETPGTYQVRVAKARSDATAANAQKDDKNIATVTLTSAPASDAELRVEYTVQGLKHSERVPASTVQKPDREKKYTFQLEKHSVDTDSIQVWEIAPAADARLLNDPASRTARVVLPSAPGDRAEVYVDYDVPLALPPALAAPGEARLCTSFNEFRQWFGDFSLDPGQRRLAHAVYGFFNNGGARCYVGRAETPGGVRAVLDAFARIDEIAIVAAPGITDDAVRSDIVAHCELMGDRFAIFDGPESIDDLTLLDPSNDANILPRSSDYAAFYVPWIQVFDPFSEDRIYVPPSGHIAGIYARVDTQRGVHKAPANEPVRGALALRTRLSRDQQEGLNPQGVNCIRDLNGALRVWGARTLGGDANGEWKYINVRRLFLFLRKSIDQGTQWVVFEPNEPALWAKITRNVTAFLTNVWRAGALFGATPQEAFYVKCDAETNPPDVRELGQVVTEIGVAVTRPAEFVIFRISQWAGPD